MLEVKDLKVSYGKHRALEGVSLQVRPGEIVVILGANGAGKSSLLRAIAGISEGRVEGQITQDKEPITGLAPHRIVERGIALVPEGRGIFGDMTVRENLTLGANPARARDEQDANLDRLYKLFPKLRERAAQVARTMSGGEQQMVAIGRAMMSNPTILMLDEPSLGLSPLLCKELFQSLKAVRAAGLGILLVEQNARQSLAIADRGYLLENGRIVHHDTAQNLMNDPAVQAAYLGAGGHAAGPAKPQAAPDLTQAVAELPEPIRPRIRQPRPASADDLAGTDIASLVARAGVRARSEAPRANGASSPAVSASHDRLRATIAEIERAAASARRRESVAILPRATAAPPAAAPQPAAPAAPVTIEIYRAPRVEVYRRRPGAETFERKES